MRASTLAAAAVMGRGVELVDPASHMGPAETPDGLNDRPLPASRLNPDSHDLQHALRHGQVSGGPDALVILGVGIGLFEFAEN